MSLPQDLLEQANHLCQRESVGPPKQASLRRAVSAAYYALFHLLTAEGAAVCAPVLPALLRPRVQRAFEHGHMKKVCSAIYSGGTHASLKPLLTPSMVFPPSIRQVARAFVSLQEARHTADYDTAFKHSRAYTDQLVFSAVQACSIWKSAAGSPEANVFLVALLLQDKWGR